MNQQDPTFNTAVLTDHDLLLGGVLDLVEENKLNARRWARLVEIHRRNTVRCASDEARRPGEALNDAWGPMTPREWTALDTSETWAMGDLHTRTELNIALFLVEHLHGVWDLCASGALDRFRAKTVADLIRHRVTDPDQIATIGARITGFLRKHLRRYDVTTELNTAMVTCTITQLRNRLNYEIRKLVPADEEFVKNFADRTVHATETDDGIGVLSITNSIDQVKLARHRLHLSATALRNNGDQRTINQLMADLALDLIIGRAENVPVPAYARPIINVTVPLETLAGLTDDPGQLSGGTVIPADLARAIATREGATWYRLLTDPAGDPVALSTKSYSPTNTIWRHVVATRPTCSHKGCDRPSVECELDHNNPWPEGATSTENLDPLCRRHHKAKHARAIRPELEWEYAYAS